MAKTLSPAIAQVVEFISGQIGSGEYVAGSFLPSENQLAAELNVSRGTVREAIEFLSSSGELTKRAHSRPIIGLMKEPTSARTATEVHVWVSHPIEDDASLVFVKGVSRGLSGTPYQMIVREPTRFQPTYVEADEYGFFENLLRDDAVAGAIVQRDPWAGNDELVKRVLETGKPLVFVDCPAPSNLLADHVGTANRASARRLVEHLIQLGHRQIVCVADSETSEPVVERIRGYRRAMVQAGFEDEVNVVVADEIEHIKTAPIKLGGTYAARIKKNKWFAETAHRLASHVLNLRPRPTAIFVTGDVLAYWVAALLEGRGLNIPDDISVVGFDWLGRWGAPDADTLTTAAQDFEGFGRYAADFLLDRLEGNVADTPRQLLLEAPLVVRSSTAPEHSLWASPIEGDDSEKAPSALLKP